MLGLYIFNICTIFFEKNNYIMYSTIIIQKISDLNRTSSKKENLVSIVSDFVEQFNHMFMISCESKHGENMTFYVGFSDRSINIRQNKTTVLFIQKDIKRDTNT